MISLERIGPHAPAFVIERLAEIFSSDAQFFAVTEGRGAWSVDEIVAYLKAEEGARAEAYVIVRTSDETLCGLVTILPHHPREPHPWIGLLIVDAALRGRGLGTRAADLAESALRARGFSTARLGVDHGTPRAREFWEARGYRAVDERETAAGRAVTVYHKSLA